MNFKLIVLLLLSFFTSISLLFGNISSHAQQLFQPGEKHRDDVTATNAMTHISIQEQLDGKMVNWMDKVSDEQWKKRMH